MSDENQDPATNAQQDLIKRMEELASEMKAPPASVPAPSAAPSDDGGQDMMRRMAELAAEMSAAQTPSPASAAPVPKPIPTPAPPVAARDAAMNSKPEQAAAAEPDVVSIRALRTLADMVREVKGSLGHLEGAFARDSTAVQDALRRLAARPAAAPSAAAPASGEVLETLMQVKGSLDQLKDSSAVESASLKESLRRLAARPAPAAAAPASNEALEILRGLKDAVAARLQDPGPSLTALAQSMLELKALVVQQLGSRDKRIAELEARLAARPERAGADLAPEPSLDDLADSMRDMQASMERMREAMKADLNAAISGLKHGMAGQLARLPSGPPAETAPAAARISHIHPSLASAPTFDALRQELLGPMAAMKAQLLDLTMSYHQLSLRLAVLAAQERTSGPGMLE